MTNREKQELRGLCKSGLSFKTIKTFVSCSDSTIKRYMELFSPAPTNNQPKKG